MTAESIAKALASTPGQSHGGIVGIRPRHTYAAGMEHPHFPQVAVEPVVRRNRRPDWRRIKSLRSYTIDEAARALSVHSNAVRYWIKKCDLPVFCDQRPHLIQGSDLVAFLKGRRAAKRRKCAPGQFFCLKCRQPRAPAGGMVDFYPMDSLRGVLVGMCPNCEMLMRRFVSRARLAAVASQFNMQISHQQKSLRDTTTPSLNCHFNDTD